MTGKQKIDLNQTTVSKIASYLVYQRKKRCLTLQNLAEMADLTPSYLSKLEAGEFDSISLDVVIKLARGLEMSLADFLYKCQLIDFGASYFPDLRFYLREKYQFPTQAVADVEMFMEFIQIKYADEIKANLKAHEEYWSKGGKK